VDFHRFPHFRFDFFAAGFFLAAEVFLVAEAFFGADFFLAVAFLVALRVVLRFGLAPKARSQLFE
jgi:hypothetical protein